MKYLHHVLPLIVFVIVLGIFYAILTTDHTTLARTVILDGYGNPLSSIAYQNTTGAGGDITIAVDRLEKTVWFQNYSGGLRWNSPNVQWTKTDGVAWVSLFAQTDITNVSTGLTTGIMTVTNGTGALGSITNNSTNWNTAYGWGNHASGGYLKANGTVDLSAGWTIATQNITLTAGTLTAANIVATTSVDVQGGDITLQNDEVIDNSVNGTVELQAETALTNAVSPQFSILHTTSGVPAANIGVGIQFVQETSAGNNEVGMSLDAVASDVTGAAENFDLSIKLMTGGAAKAEKFKLTGTGVVTLVNAATIDNTTNGIVTITEPTVSLAGAVKYVNCPLGDSDATPDVTGCYWLTSQANTNPTAITDLDNPVVGAQYCLIVGNATNAPTITDGGNFALSGDWTPDLDDVLCVYVQADNDYLEVTRSAN